MVKVIYVTHDGTRHETDVAAGSSVMQGAIFNDVPGITGDCGGAATCATCHVHVDPDWTVRTGAAQEQERTMLEIVYEPDVYSRLSCQITITPELDGLVVNVPEYQC